MTDWVARAGQAPADGGGVMRAIIIWIAGFATGIASSGVLWQQQDRRGRRQAYHRADATAYHRRARGFCSPSPATIAECGGPCERGFEYCHCGLFEEMNQ
jgi:hypothetical protein